MSVAFDLEREQERIDALGRAVEEKINQAFKEKLFGEGKLFDGSFELFKITVVPPKVYSNQHAPHKVDELAEGVPPAFQLKSSITDNHTLKKLLSSIGAEDILTYEHDYNLFRDVEFRLGFADAERIVQHEGKHEALGLNKHIDLTIGLLAAELNEIIQSVAPKARLAVAYESKETNLQQVNFHGHQILARELPNEADIGTIMNKLAQLAGCSAIDRTLGIISKSNSRIEADNSVRVSDSIIQKMLAGMGTQQEPGPQREQMTAAIESMMQEKSRAVA